MRKCLPFGNADAIALFAPAICCLKEMINISNVFVDLFAREYYFSFNPMSYKFMRFNVITPLDTTVFWKAQKVEIVECDVHLVNYIGNDLSDFNITRHACHCELYQRSNNVINDFKVYDCVS